VNGKVDASIEYMDGDTMNKSTRYLSLWWITLGLIHKRWCEFVIVSFHNCFYYPQLCHRKLYHHNCMSVVWIPNKQWLKVIVWRSTFLCSCNFTCIQNLGKCQRKKI
jgi:hypothetical protein